VIDKAASVLAGAVVRGAVDVAVMLDEEEDEEEEELLLVLDMVLDVELLVLFEVVVAGEPTL
jgi:hypothetical protein